MFLHMATFYYNHNQIFFQYKIEFKYYFLINYLIMTSLTLPVSTTLHLVVGFLEKQGLCVDYDDLHTHILNVEQEKNLQKQKKRIKFKPKKHTNIINNNNNSNDNNVNDNDNANDNDNDNDNDNNKQPTKKKFKVTNPNENSKKKFKIKNKQNDYEKFVKICNDNNLHYFQFNDEYNWKGPSIKIDQDTFDLSIFQNLEIHLLEGFGFAIVRPKNSESDKKINYNEINYESCKILDEDTYSLNGSDDEEYSQNCYNEETEYEEEEVYTEDWIFVPKNILYQLDPKTNNIYCNQTNMYVGKKIDDFNIDYDSKEHENIPIDSVA